MTVDASHRLQVQLSMDEGEFTRGLGFATAELEAFKKTLKGLAAESVKVAATTQANMAKIAASAQAAASGGAKAAATATAAATAQKAAAQGAAATTGAFTRYLDFANKNKVAWNQTANRMAIAGGVMVGVFGLVTAGYARFEKAMDDATAVIDVSIYDMGRLSEQALEMGRTTLFSATEAAQGIEALAKAGVSAKDIYGGALQGAVNLAAAGNISLAEAAETASIMMIQFNKSGKDVPHIADLLAAAAGKAVGDVHDLAMALKQGGLIASQFGLSIEDTASTLALFAQNGLLGSDAGTSLKIMLLRLAAPATRAQKEMAKLGIDAWDANGAFVGMEKFAGQLQSKLGDLTLEQQDHALAVIFGTDAMRSAAIMLKEGANGYKAMAEAVNDAGFAEEVMRKRMDNLMGDLKRFAGAWDSLVASAGKGSNSALRSITQSLTDLTNSVGRMDPGELNAWMQFVLGFGGAALGIAALMKLTIGVNNFRKAIAGADGIFGSFLGKMKGAPIAFLAVAAVLTAIAVETGIAEARMRDMIGTTDDLIGELARLAASGSLDEINQRFLKVTNVSLSQPGKNIAEALKTYKAYLTDGLARFNIDNLSFLAPNAGGDIKLLKEYDAALSALVSSGDIEKAQTAFAELLPELQKAGFTTEDIAKAFPLLNNSMVAFANGLNLTVTPSAQDYVDMMAGKMPPAIALAIAKQNELNGTFTRTGVAALDAAADVRAAVNQMVADLTNALKGIQADVSFEAAIDDAKSGIKDLLGVTGKLTKEQKKARAEITKINKAGTYKALVKEGAGRTVATNASKIAESGMASLQTDIAEGLNDPAKIKARIAGINAEIVKMAKDAGLSKDVIADLVAEIGLVPETIQTTFSSPGADITKQQAKDLKTAVDLIPGLKEVKILAPGARPSKADVEAFMSTVQDLPPEAQTIIQTIAELGGVEAAKTALATIKDVPAWILTEVNKSGVNWWARYQPKDKEAWINAYIKMHNNARQGGPKLADGGPVPGWSPNKRADNIPIMATAREFMQPVASVDYYGEAFMEKIRRRMIPKSLIQHLASGGPVRDQRTYVQAPMRVTTDAGSSNVNTGSGMTVNNVTYYPIAEPVSTSQNRGLQLAASVGKY